MTASVYERKTKPEGSDVMELEHSDHPSSSVKTKGRSAHLKSPDQGKRTLFASLSASHSVLLSFP